MTAAPPETRIGGGQKPRRPASLEAASLCSLAVALWGWHTGLWFLAVPMVLGLEARRVIQPRWAVGVADLRELAKLSGALTAMLFVVILLIKRAVFIYTLLQWLPVAAFPLALVQTYGLQVSDRLREGFANPYLLRRGIRPQGIALNLHYAYFALCLLAASAADSDHYGFYLAAVGVTGLLLWTARPKRTAPALWLLLFCLAGGLGFAGQWQLAQFQHQLESQVIALLSDMATGRTNPTGTATQMGSVGRLKLSNKIVFRVWPDAPAEGIPTPQFPLLLREATYNQYQLSTWTATDSLFRAVLAGKSAGQWRLGSSGALSLEPLSPDPPRPSITISGQLARGKEILALPHGTTEVQDLPVEAMQRNQYGAVQISAEGPVTYRVVYQPEDELPASLAVEAPPTPTDLAIPQVDQVAIETTLERLALAGKSEGEKVRAIAAHLQTFRYSLDLLRPTGGISPVSDFLLAHQAGHCEYFASAAALLLRGAGIPARYAVGYSVHEYSPLERRYLVRSRDAHAWTLVYLGGHWQVLDTTPPDWRAQEQALTSPLQSLSDTLSFLSYQASSGLQQLGELESQRVLLLMLPVFAYVLIRSLQQIRAQRQNTPLAPIAAAAAQDIPRLGLDSELFLIEQWLKEQGFERSPAEPLRQWAERVGEQIPSPHGQILKEILTLHYRYRFDPQGLSAAERTELAQRSQDWLQQTLMSGTIERPPKVQRSSGNA